MSAKGLLFVEYIWEYREVVTETSFEILLNAEVCWNDVVEPNICTLAIYHSGEIARLADLALILRGFCKAKICTSK
jgi:hypothetical protein